MIFMNEFKQYSVTVSELLMKTDECPTLHAVVGLKVFLLMPVFVSNTNSLILISNLARSSVILIVS